MAAPAGRTPPSDSRSPFSRGLLAAIGVVGAIAVVIVLVVLFTGGSSKPTSSTTASTSSSRSAKRSNRLTVSPSAVTVAVLNGTATNDLAHRIAAQLTGLGYKVPASAVVTAPDQTHTTTIVAYLPGSRRDAQAVATSLKVPPSSVQPVDPSSQQVACSGTTPCNANVVVTIGADLVSRA